MARTQTRHIRGALLVVLCALAFALTCAFAASAYAAPINNPNDPEYQVTVDYEKMKSEMAKGEKEDKTSDSDTGEEGSDADSDEDLNNENIDTQQAAESELHESEVPGAGLSNDELPTGPEKEVSQIYTNPNAHVSDGSGVGAVVTIGEDGGIATIVRPEDAENAEDSQSSDVPAVPLDASGNNVNEGQISDTTFLYDAEIVDLAGADSYYDNQMVQISGEAVGEPLVDGDPLNKTMWVTLRDNATGTTVAVNMSEEDALRIVRFGSYKTTGSYVRVYGEYHMVCKTHQGDADIHAQTVSVLSEGEDLDRPFVLEDFVPGLIFVGIGVLSFLMYRVLRERAR